MPGHAWSWLITPYLLKCFSLLTIFLQAKNSLDPMISSLDICDPRILQSDWLRGLYRKIDDNINFCLRSFSAKIFQKRQHFSKWFQNPRFGLFWPFLVILLQVKLFQTNPHIKYVNPKLDTEVMMWQTVSVIVTLYVGNLYIRGIRYGYLLFLIKRWCNNF